MNALFGNLKTEGLEEAQDRLGGFRVLDSDAYTGEIKLAYAGKAASSNAMSLSVVLAHANGEYRETFWVTNKAGENFYTKQGETKKHMLPGFIIANDLCRVTLNKELCEVLTEEKMINLYNSDQKKEIPTSVQMLTELLGKKVTFGIQKHLKNKQTKDNAGVYQDTAESREENVTDKIFHYPSNMTVVEALKGITTPGFYDEWLKVNKGNVQDRRTIKDGVAGGAKNGRPGIPPKAGETPAKTSSLFGAA